MVALVALKEATYTYDQPFSYIIPSALRGLVAPGQRVIVPFGRNNRAAEALVLSIDEHAGGDGKMKTITGLLDDTPVLSQKDLKLLFWLRERCFCTVYDALNAMLPAGLSYKLQSSYTVGTAEPESLDQAAIIDYINSSGGSAAYERLILAFSDGNLPKMLSDMCSAGMLTQSLSGERAMGDKTRRVVTLSEEFADAPRTSAAQKKVAAFLDGSECTVKEVCYYTGVSPQTVASMVKKGLLTAREREIMRTPAEISAAQGEKTPPPVLTDSQIAAAAGFLDALNADKPSCGLLKGITGSGKTAIYINLIDKCIRMNKSAMILVPEIALTPQLVSRFCAHFGDAVAVLHSGLSSGERYDQWKRIRAGEINVVIGTRSAVFAPLEHIGLIVIDEEQEYTYKSEAIPRYNTRDVAKFRCVQHSALLLLGSATPSVESYHNAMSGRYLYAELSERYADASLPDVIFADMSQELRDGNKSPISGILARELYENKLHGEQSILFINRRGRSRQVYCPSCGDRAACPHCSVGLSYHSANGRLMCHYCGYSTAFSPQCTICGGEIRQDVAGTQRIEEELRRLISGISIIRMDTDTTSTRQSHQRLLDRFVNEKIDVLLGTQMVAKGLDFPNVTLVGVIDAGQTLIASDFRANERTFSQLTQVIGRAGRADKPGRAVLQTFTPNSPVLQTAARQDYNEFYTGEIALRQAMNYPPFCDMVYFTLSGADEDRVNKAAARFTADLLGLTAGEYADLPCVLLGPAPAPIYKLNDRFRLTVMIKTEENRRLRRMIESVLKGFMSNRLNLGLSLAADINPLY